MTTQELFTAFHDAKNASEAAQRERNAYVTNRVDTERRLAGEAADAIYSARLKELREIADAAYSAHRAQLDADARAGVGAVFPPGTVFVEWSRPRRRFGYTDAGSKLLPTENRARYVAVTQDTVLPANRSYGVPKLGDYILQRIRKDGKPGIAYVESRDLGGWYPEGVDPNVPETSSK